MRLPGQPSPALLPPSSGEPRARTTTWALRRLEVLDGLLVLVAVVVPVEAATRCEGRRRRRTANHQEAAALSRIRISKWWWRRVSLV